MLDAEQIDEKAGNRRRWETRGSQRMLQSAVRYRSVVCA
jgi:hypothetical protein